MDDVIDDIARGIVNAAGFAHFGLFFNFRHASRGETDDAAQKLFIDLSEDFDRNFIEDVRARVVSGFDDIAQNLIVNFQGWGEAVRLGSLIFFGREMEQAGIVFLIGFLKEDEQVGIDILAVGNFKELIFGLNFAVFTNAQKEDAVDGGLDGVV